MQTSENKAAFLQQIYEIWKKSKNNGWNLKTSENTLIKVSKHLKCSFEQAYLFTLIMNLSINNRSTNINEIAEHLGLEPIDVLSKYHDIREMAKKNLLKIVVSKDDSISEFIFSVPYDVIEKLIKGSDIYHYVKPQNDIITFLFESKKIMEDYKHNLYNLHEFETELQKLFNQYKSLKILDVITSFQLNNNEIKVLLSMCHNIIEGQDEISLNNILKDNILSPSEQFYLKRSIVKGNNPLIKNKLLKVEEGIFRSDRDLFFTKFGLQYIFDEDAEVLVSNSFFNDTKLTIPEKIPERKMHYNQTENKEINFLAKYLKNNNYYKVLKKLEQYKLSKSITILLYGDSGTGKTETVYQLAKTTGRSIFHVNISETKSKWFGESEKKIKEVFDNYKIIVDQSEHHPILLFNEADGVLGKRNNGDAALDQTKNAIQNIILQELEDMKGILIATTNLTNNLDKAFDRRFLYKIRLNKPNASIRFRIWADNIPELSKSEISILAKKYDLTGGQIVNISKKYLIKKVLDNKSIDINEIEVLCNNEKLVSVNKQKIGYK